MVEEATVVGEVVCVAPSYLMVMIEEAGKPVPVTVTVVPTLPAEGLSVMETVTEKAAVAVWEDASVAVTVWAPKVEAGTVKEAENKPELSVVAVATVDEPNVTVTPELDEKLVPETVTREPTAPNVGLKLIPAFRVKVADAEFENASVAVTAWAPFVETGTVNVALNEPVALVLELPMIVASNVTVIDEDPAKPAPLTVNEEPAWPPVGLNVIDAITVIEAVAVWEDASVAVTEWAPVVEAGIVKVALNAPAVDVVTVAGEVVTVVPSYLMVMVEEAAKPVPVTVMVAPTLPLAGLSVMEEIMLKVAVAEWEDASVAVTV